MLTIKILNDGTGDEAVGNYDYQVWVNAETIAKGRVEGHKRLTGWQGLVQDLAKRLGE